jgi:hypothetical protein
MRWEQVKAKLPQGALTELYLALFLEVNERRHQTILPV